MINDLLALYDPRRSAATITYMLQSTEYDAAPYLRWYWRTHHIGRVMYRRTLDHTRAATLLKQFLMLGMALQALAGVAMIALGWSGHITGGLVFGLALLLSYPIVWAHIVVVPLTLGRLLIIQPKQRRLVAASEATFANHPAVRIAIAGSYGKTTMKELLGTVLAEGKHVAITPGNENVAVSHARFARKLTGDEDVLVIEYGEDRPGSIAAFARTTHPTYGIITGLSPAHLDRYKTIDAAGEDIFSLADYVPAGGLYVNKDSAALRPFLKLGHTTYDAGGTLGWKVQRVALRTSGTEFDLVKGTRKLRLKSGLLGMHQVGPLSLAAALGLELGLSDKQVTSGIAKTKPHEHRMQPYQLNGGWIIDDTYNGNIEGIRAGTALLKALPAQRKLYVTPGLVDQGAESDQIHQEMGRLIAAAKPDVVVLMQNSATAAIRQGLEASKYGGKTIIETDPLNFYTNLNQFVAAGDLVLMQNDWTDNYA